jgi:hypothetical protein
MQVPMKTALLTLALAGLALPFLRASDVAATDPAPSAGGATASAHPLESQYIGASKCKACHKSEETGDPYGAWEKSPHARAFESLATDAAKQAGAARGVDDPQKAEACLQCHETGFGLPAESFKKGFKAEAGVQCETCHGPGADHMKERFAAAASGETKPGYLGLAVNEMNTTPGVDVCTKCHNPESPSYKPFCYYEARGKIAHLDPRKPRSEEEKARFGLCPHGSPCPHAAGCPDGTCNLTPEELAELTAKFKE